VRASVSWGAGSLLWAVRLQETSDGAMPQLRSGETMIFEDQTERNFLRDIHDAMDRANADEGNKRRLCLYCGSTTYDAIQGIAHAGRPEGPHGCIIQRLRRRIRWLEIEEAPGKVDYYGYCTPCLNGNWAACLGPSNCVRVTQRGR